MYSSGIMWQNIRKQRKAIYERLGRQVLGSVHPCIQEAWWRCGTLRRLRSLCLKVRGGWEKVRDLSDLLDRALVSAADPELRRLFGIYTHCLEPVVARHFDGEERERLRRGLKRLILLRWLGVPYRPGYPGQSGEGEELLSSLHRLCDGKGLMIWDGEGETVYAVEANREQFVEWIIEWTAGLLGRAERDKAVSDALWSALFPPYECGRRWERVVIGAGFSFTLSWAPFPGREAVVVQRHGGGRWGIVFESPWSIDLGVRTHQAVRVMESKVDVARILVWMPRRLSQDEAAEVYRYMAAGRALRRALLEGQTALEDPVVWVLQERYREAGAVALQALLASYREGSVIAEGEVWRVEGGRESLVGLMGDLIAWAGSLGPERRAGPGPVPFKEGIRSSSFLPPGYGGVSLPDRRLGGGL